MIDSGIQARVELAPQHVVDRAEIVGGGRAADGGCVVDLRTLGGRVILPVIIGAVIVAPLDAVDVAVLELPRRAVRRADRPDRRGAGEILRREFQSGQLDRAAGRDLHVIDAQLAPLAQHVGAEPVGAGGDGRDGRGAAGVLRHPVLVARGRGLEVGGRIAQHRPGGVGGRRTAAHDVGRDSAAVGADHVAVLVQHAVQIVQRAGRRDDRERIGVQLGGCRERLADGVEVERIRAEQPAALDALRRRI